MRAIKWISGLFVKQDSRSEEERERDAKRAEGIGQFVEGYNYFNSQSTSKRWTVSTGQ